MGKRRRTRAEKVRRDQRRAAVAIVAVGDVAVQLPCGCPPSARAPEGPRKQRTREFDGQVQVENFYVERDSVTFGFDHPKLRHATYGKSGIVRDGPFRTWATARASIADGDAPGARIVAVWEDQQTASKRKPGAFQNDDGTVTLVKASRDELIAASADEGE
jgi:hypothetical protein